MQNQSVVRRSPKTQHNLARITAATFVSALMVVGVSESASAVASIDVDYSLISFDNPETDLTSTDSDDIGYDAQLNDTVDYLNVYPGVDARITVVQIVNLSNEVDKIDEGQSTTDLTADDSILWVEIDPPGATDTPATGGLGSATLRIDFFESGGVFTTPVTLNKVAITVKDIDALQSATFSGISSYLLSATPASVLVVTQSDDKVTFAETLDDSSGSAEEQHWAVVRYAATSSITVTVGALNGGDAEFGMLFTQPTWTVAPNESAITPTEEVIDGPDSAELANTGQNEDFALWGALGLVLAIVGATTVRASARRSRS